MDRADDLLTVGEAARLLRASPAQTYRWIASGKLPAYRRAGRLLVRRADAEGMLRAVVPSRPPAFTQEQRAARMNPGTERTLREAGML